MKSLHSFTKTLAVFCLSIGPAPAILAHLTGQDAAFADSSNGKGNGGGNGGGNSNNGGGGNSNAGGKSGDTGKAGKSNGNGALASELKGMNAIHASATALKNASPNSQVGKIAAYQDAALHTQAIEMAVETATSNLAAAQAALAEAEAMPATTPEEIAARDAAIAAATTGVDGATSALAAAQAELESAAAEEEATLLVATDGRVLSAEALAYIRQELGL